MYVEISKDAVLFYKALEDIWCAERTYEGSPNNAVWSCCQAAEKIMKGFLQCFGEYSENTHDLNVILEYVEDRSKLQKDVLEAIHNLAIYDQRLRYKNLRTDPTAQNALEAIADTKLILSAFSSHDKCSTLISEAREVHTKMLRNISDDSKPCDH